MKSSRLTAKSTAYTLSTQHYTHCTRMELQRFNHVTIKGAHTLLIQKDLPKSLWAEAIRHITYLNNRIPHRALTENIIPYKAFAKKKPNLGGIQEFGAKRWVLDRTNTDKLMRKSHKATFVGYQGDRRIIHYWDGTRQ